MKLGIYAGSLAYHQTCTVEDKDQDCFKNKVLSGTGEIIVKQTLFTEVPTGLPLMPSSPPRSKQSLCSSKHRLALYQRTEQSASDLSGRMGCAWQLCCYYVLTVTFRSYGLLSRSASTNAPSLKQLLELKEREERRKGSYSCSSLVFSGYLTLV